MDYKRYYIPNALVFITQVVYDREPIFANPAHVALLRSILHQVSDLHPFHMLAYVFLPDHFHLLIKPEPDVTHSQIMHSIKPNFTKAYKQALTMTGHMHFWQRRYWDHVIRDEDDLHRHLDYIHYNPVKHGLVSKPEEWSDSSYCYWQQRDAYPHAWGWSLPDTLCHVSDDLNE